jgi:two-component system, NarL family, nitrate/nitrite response regulator NarL
VTAVIPNRVSASGIPPRILVAGNDLLAEALASALESYGFTTTNITANDLVNEEGIDWSPDLVLLDARSLDVDAGSALIGGVCQMGVQVCVIDAADDGQRSNAWLTAGTAALIDKGEPFDELFRTITLLLRNRLLSQAAPRYHSAAATAAAPVDDRRPERLALFASLSDREKMVLAELIEGHCAEDIAKGAFVSISTVRSQIKSILQKLGVNSQLAAVALARRADWSLQRPPSTPPEPTNSRRRRVS